MGVGGVGYLVFVDAGDSCVSGTMNVVACRRGGVRMGNNERGWVGRKNSGVRAFLLGQAGEPASQSGNIEVPLERRFFRRREVDQSLCFVNRIQRSDFPFTPGNLPELLAFEIIKIDMAVTAGFAGPQEAFAVFHGMQIAADVDPLTII